MDYLKDLICLPSSQAINRSISIEFWQSFKNVAYIGDCLEISIEKPSDAFEQALTWSDYKKRHTIKYYVAIKPNRLFAFDLLGMVGGPQMSS